MILLGPSARRRRIEKFLVIVETKIGEELLVDLSFLELFDVLERDFDLDILAAKFLVRMGVGNVNFKRPRFARFHAGKLLVQIDHIDAADSSRTGDKLRIVLMAHDIAVELDVNVGDDVVLVGNAAVFHRDERSLLLLKVLHRLVDVLIRDFDLGLFHLQAADIRHGELGLNFNLEGIAQALIFLELNRIGIIKFRFADDVQAIFLNRLLIALGDEGAADLFANVGGEALFDELLRGVPGPKAGDGGVLAQVLELVGEDGIDPILGDFDGDLLSRGAGVLNLDLVLVSFFGLFRDCGFILGHDILA